MYISFAFPALVGLGSCATIHRLLESSAFLLTGGSSAGGESESLLTTGREVSALRSRGVLGRTRTYDLAVNSLTGETPKTQGIFGIVDDPTTQLLVCKASQTIAKNREELR
jgi:hypothetical protein